MSNVKVLARQGRYRKITQLSLWINANRHTNRMNHKINPMEGNGVSNEKNFSSALLCNKFWGNIAN